MLHPSLDFTGKQTRQQAVLIILGLLYLSIPNLLFLWGWFTPMVSLPLSALIIVIVGRASWCTLRDTEKAPAISHILWWVVGIAASLLISFYFLFRAGILGVVSSYGDLTILRNAMFANLRDAAWPLILPDGKEMSYYLANVLPSAMMARLAPHSGQWSVVIWTLPCMLLIIFMVSTLITERREGGCKMLVSAIFLGVLCCSYFYPAIVLLTKLVNVVFHLNVCLPSCGHPIVHGHALSGCGGVYNSYPPALLVTSILLICRNRAEVVLPVALALMVPLSPFAGVGMMPLVVLRWWESVRRADNIRLSSLLPDALLPLAMAVICAVYFLRADGESAVSLTPMAWGWRSFLIHEAWRMGGLLTLLLPLWLYVKRDAFFYCLMICYILMPILFIGTMPAPGKGGNNELWLKVAPCYMLISVAYWLLSWRVLPWFKYILMGLCLLMTVIQVRACARLAGCNGYLEVDDRWNGHMNHNDPFFNQSLPRCKAPLIPGVMLEKSGESEECFPGCLLPKAPGCDYSRPANPDASLRWQ